jgi:hypothetical protein
MKARLALALLCVFLCFSFSCGLVEHKNIDLRALNDFEQWGFAAGGTINLKTTINPPQENVSVYICTDKEFDLLNSYSDADEMGFCNNPYVCEKTSNYKVALDYAVHTKNVYRIFFI